MIFILCVFYFGMVAMIGKMTPGGGGGEKLTANGKIVGYVENPLKLTPVRQIKLTPVRHFKMTP